MRRMDLSPENFISAAKNTWRIHLYNKIYKTTLAINKTKY